MKDAFGGLISRQDTAEQRISKLENMAVEASQIEKAKRKEKTEEKNPTEYSRTVEKLQKL